MTRTTTSALALALAAATLAAPAPAQETADALSDADVIALADWNTEDLYANGVSADDFIDDMEVYGAGGEEIGDVEDVIVGPDGTVIAIIAEVGGLWDIGDTHVSIPFDLVELAPDGSGIIVPLSEENVDDYDIATPALGLGTMQEGPVGELDDADLGPRAWRISELIGDYARLRDDDAIRDYGYVSDVILENGAVTAVIVQPAFEYGENYRAWPYYGYEGGADWDAGSPYYDIEAGEDEISDLADFEYDRLGE